MAGRAKEHQHLCYEGSGVLVCKVNWGAPRKQPGGESCAISVRYQLKHDLVDFLTMHVPVFLCCVPSLLTIWLYDP